jgi:hypothetical protein
MVECGDNWVMGQSRALLADGWEMEHGQGLDQRRDTQTQPVGRCISDDEESDNNTRSPILRVCKVGYVVGWREEMQRGRLVGYV